MRDSVGDSHKICQELRCNSRCSFVYERVHIEKATIWFCSNCQAGSLQQVVIFVLSPLCCSILKEIKGSKLFLSLGSIHLVSPPTTCINNQVYLWIDDNNLDLCNYYRCVACSTLTLLLIWLVLFQFHIPKYMPNTIAAPRKAPRVWKKKNNGNFLHGSLPSKHSERVTAGFRWPPKDEKNIETLVYFHTSYPLSHSIWFTHR